MPLVLLLHTHAASPSCPTPRCCCMATPRPLLLPPLGTSPRGTHVGAAAPPRVRGADAAGHPSVSRAAASAPTAHGAEPVRGLYLLLLACATVFASVSLAQALPAAPRAGPLDPCRPVPQRGVRGGEGRRREEGAGREKGGGAAGGEREEVAGLARGVRVRGLLEGVNLKSVSWRMFLLPCSERNISVRVYVENI